MTPLVSLWMPIVLSAVIVFALSSIIHMVTKWHANDFPLVADQGRILDAIRKLGLAPGDYGFPRPKDMADMKSPEFQKMYEGGPVMMTVLPPGPMAMGGTMGKWFFFCLVVNLFAGYVASAALGPGTTYLKVFQVVGTSAFMGYAFAIWPLRIWYKRGMTLTVKGTIDGLVYALFTAGTFGWLWPK